MLAVGIDIEPDIPLPEDVIDTVLGPDERGAREQARAIFCAKEATYKALYPLSRQVWEFGDIGIRLDPAGNGFTADLRRVAGPIAAGAMLKGHLIAEDGLCIAALILPRA